MIDYDDANVATETEAQEIVERAVEFVAAIEQLIAAKYPSLKA